MKYLRDKNTIVIQLDIGDELISSVIDVCKKENVTSGYITGIGATDNAEVGVLIPSTKEYIKQIVSEDFEVTALSGNITVQNDIPYPHVHATLANINKMLGGHVNKMVMSVLGEVFIYITHFDIGRKKDERTGATIMVIE